MNQPTDEMVVEVLRDTFTAHEHLADPDRARALVPTDTQPGRVRLGLVSAAMAAVVVAGVVLVPSWDSDDGDPGDPGPTMPTTALPDPAEDAARVRAENQRRKAAAASEAETVLASMPVPRGATRVPGSRTPALKESSLVIGGGKYFVTRTAYWWVPGPAIPLADWYSLHPPSSMETDGGPHGVGGVRNVDGSWSETVFYNGVRSPAAHSGADVLVTPVEPPKFMSAPFVMSGVRISVTTEWHPTRPAVSYAPDDVTAVRIVRIPAKGARTTTVVTDPGRLPRLVTAYDDLDGWAEYWHSCPMSPQIPAYKVTFVGESRTVTARWDGSCQYIWDVRVDGQHIAPWLDDEYTLSRLVARLTRS